MQQRTEQYLVLFTLWLLVFASASQVMIIAPILSLISAQLHVDESLLSSLMAVYAVGVGVFALITGPLSDRFGRRNILIVGTGLMTVALGLHALADSFLSLLIYRALAGAAGGILSGAAVAYIGDYFPATRRGWANGWVMSGMAAGQILGIPLGTLAADALGFRAPFLAFAVVTAATMLLLWRVVPQPDVERAKDPVSLRGAFDNYRSLLRRSEIRAASMAYVLMFLSISLFVIYLPTWMEKDFGFTHGSIAALYFIGGLANVLAGPWAGRLSDRIGRKGVIVAASLGVAAVTIATPWVTGLAVWTPYALFFLAMALFAARMSPLQALLSELVSSDRRGSLISLAMAIGQIGFAVGSALAGAAYAGYGFAGNAVLSTISLLVMAWMVWRFLPEPALMHKAEAGSDIPTTSGILSGGVVPNAQRSPE